ncbi:MAG: NifB/NifX family molybdenum-iron cluster-binding protein [Desulfamplus sp.]|nr:NifB/NifX family molybdenum-iron cluster-binding protein [Desulfamplus sp.]
MKFAIPMAMGKLTAHFGHCKEFCFVTTEDQKVKNREVLVPPPHEPGVLPKWLHDHGINVVIAGGMGHKAQELFSQAGIKVITGAPVEAPEKLVADYLGNSLVTGENVCGHDPNSACNHNH